MKGKLLLYKITDKDGYTRKGQEGETKWGENVTHTAKGGGNSLCTGGIIHCYKDPYLAVLMNSEHGNYDKETMLLWEAEGEIVADDGTKSGCKTLTTIKQIPLPLINNLPLVEIAIRCAMQVYHDDKFQDWAVKWITNQDRTEAAAEAAAGAAAGAAWAAAEAAAGAAAEAAAGAAAGAVAWAAAGAAWAAAGAVWAVWAVAWAAAGFDLLKIIHEVIDEK